HPLRRGAARGARAAARGAAGGPGEHRGPVHSAGKGGGVRMRCIGGLLLKDWYAARRRCWPLLPIAAVFAACTVYADSAWFAAYPLLLGAMLPVTLQAYDDACGFPRFAAALPVSRRALVGARYVTALLAPLPGAALLLLAGLIGAAFGRPLPLGAGAIAA